MQAAREGKWPGKHLSQGQGASTGGLAIAALDPTQLASKRQATELGPGPFRGPPFSSETPAQPEDLFHQAEEALGRCSASDQRAEATQDLVTYLRSISCPWFTMLLGTLTNE